MVWQYRYFNRGRCFGQYIFYAAGRLWACQAAVPGKESHFYLPDAFHDDSWPVGFASAVYHDGQDGAGQYAFGDYPSYLSQSMFIFMSRQFFYGIQRNWRRPRVSTGLAGSEPISGLSCQSQECCWQPSLFLILPARGTRTWYLPRLSAHRRNMFWW